MGMRRWRLSLVPRAPRGPLGWAEALSPRGPGLWFPLGCGSSFGFRVSDWPIGGEYSTSVLLWSRGSCHFWEGRAPAPRDKLSPDHPPCFIDISAMLLCNMADMSLPRGRGRKARKSVRGQVLDSSRGIGMVSVKGVGVGEGATDWWRGASPRSALRSASADLQHAQGERPHPTPGFTPRRMPKAHPPEADVPLATSSTGSGAGMTIMQRAHRERCCTAAWTG